MATNEVIAAVSSVVASASDLTEIYTYIPTTLNTGEIVFMYQEPPKDEIKANNLVRRTYEICVWLLVAYGSGDSTDAENRFNVITDGISLAFLANKTLNGAVRSTEVANTPHPPLIEIEKVVFRARMWTLSAWEDIIVTFA